MFNVNANHILYYYRNLLDQETRVWIDAKTEVFAKSVLQDSVRNAIVRSGGEANDVKILQFADS